MAQVRVQRSSIERKEFNALYIKNQHEDTHIKELFLSLHPVAAKSEIPGTLEFGARHRV